MNVASGTRATLIPDVQGSFIGALDASSGTLTKYGYQTYGESGATGGSFRYTGQRIDPETNGLYYYRARMYAPAWGRFMQADPIGYAGGSNLYRYVRNDPLNLNDPYGFAPDSPQPQAGGAGGNGAQPPDVAAAAAAEEPENDYGNYLQLASMVHIESAEEEATECDICSVAGPLGAGGGYPGVAEAAETAAPSTIDLLSGAANRAATTVGPGSGPVYGTAVHSVFQDEVNALGNTNLATEQSYLNGQLVDYATPGSVRLDVVEGPLTNPAAVYDLKTGSATLAPSRILQIQSHLPGNGSNIPVIEVRP